MKSKILKKEIENLDKNFGIVAKSVEAWVAVNLIQNLNLNPKFFILIGIPLPEYENRNEI